jgi:hypothetical protein
MFRTPLQLAQAINDYVLCLAADASCEIDSSACDNCVFTYVNGGSWGPLVDDGHQLSDASVNATGCVNNVLGGQTGTTTCAAKLKDELDCESAACDQCAQIDAGPGISALALCQNAALAGGCANYRTALASCDFDGSAECFQDAGEPEAAYVHRLMTLFCGGSGPGD